MTTSKHLRIVSYTDRLESVCRDVIDRFPAKKRNRFKVMHKNKWRRNFDGNTLVLSTLNDLDQRLKLGENARYVVFTEGLPAEAITKIVTLGVRSLKRLHLAHESEKAAIGGVISRLLNGEVDETPRIVDAWIEKDSLVLLAPSFARLSITLDLLERLLGNDRKKIEAFELDEDGSFLYWPHADAHLGWEQFQSLVDPTVKLRQEQSKAGYNKSYGAAIRSLREKSKLRQSDISGIDPRTLRRVEQGQASASGNTMKSLATAHGMTLNDYMQAVADEFE